MKIFISGSMSFAKEMLSIQKQLVSVGYKVKVPCDTEEFANDAELTTDDYEKDYQWCLEKDIQRKCFNIIEQSDAILVLNYSKGGIDGYVGASTLVEIGIAYYLKKKIFLLNPLPSPEKLRCAHEIKIMQPIVLNGDLRLINIGKKE